MVIYVILIGNMNIHIIFSKPVNAEFCACLNSTPVPEQNLSQVLILAIYICRIGSQNNDTMLEGFDHAFCHFVAMGPLWCNALMLYSIISAHDLKFCTPLLAIVDKHEFRNSILADQIIL